MLNSAVALFIIFFSLVLPISSMAKPLGTIPTIEKNQRRWILTGRSDLWIDMDSDKETPIRINSGELLWPLAKYEKWIGSVNIQAEGLNLNRADMLVGKNQVSLGSELRSEAIGLYLSRENEDQTSFSFYSSYASASDNTFKNSRDIWPELAAVYQFAPKGSWQWIVVLSYSKNRGYLNDQVLPFVGTLYRPSDDMQIIFGLPFFQMNWEMTVDWSMMALVTPTGFLAEAKYEITDVMNVFMNAGLTARSYLHVNRLEDEQRLYYEEKYIEAGTRLKVTDKTKMGFTMGYSFDRAAYEAKTVFDPQGSKTGFDSDLMGTMFVEFAL